MTESRRLLQHFLAALAYRTQKAVRSAPETFGDFRAAPTARTPFELVWHMTGLIGYARTMLRGGDFEPPRLATFADELARFHETLDALARDFGDATLTACIRDEQFLHGPLADAMTHVGQLAFLRRLHGTPVPSENFIFATIDAGNLSTEQALPNAPDADWRPEEMPQPPGPRRRGHEPHVAGTLEKAFGYQGDNMRLPVGDLDAALSFYQTVLGFQVTSRSDRPHKSAVLTRDRVQIGLAENGGDPTQDGCAFHVNGLEGLLAEFQANGLRRERSDFDREERNGVAWKVFYVVAPDGLCYWFGERADK